MIEKLVVAPFPIITVAPLRVLGQKNADSINVKSQVNNKNELLGLLNEFFVDELEGYFSSIKIYQYEQV